MKHVLIAVFASLVLSGSAVQAASYVKYDGVEGMADSAADETKPSGKSRAKQK